MQNSFLHFVYNFNVVNIFPNGLSAVAAKNCRHFPYKICWKNWVHQTETITKKNWIICRHCVRFNTFPSHPPHPAIDKSVIVRRGQSQCGRQHFGLRRDIICNQTFLCLNLVLMSAPNPYNCALLMPTTLPNNVIYHVPTMQNDWSLIKTTHATRSHTRPNQTHVENVAKIVSFKKFQISTERIAKTLFTAMKTFPSNINL